MFRVFIRTIILYLAVVFTMRIMGKRQIGQLQPFELVIAIMTSELASLPMQDTNIPLIHGLIPMVLLLVMQVCISILQLKSEKARSIICGKPSVLISNGRVNIKELRYQKFNINDLMEELRLQGYFNINDVEYAILETSGQVSIIPKSNIDKVTKEDMKVKAQQDKLPVSLILDGRIDDKNLKIINKNRNWLNDQLRINKISSPEDVFVAILDSKNKFYYQMKEGMK